MSLRFLLPAVLPFLVFYAIPSIGETVYEDNFNGFADGERPSSIYEVRGTPWVRGEVVGKRYAINAGGNRHRLIMPKVADFELTFTAEPHERAPYAPIMIIEFRRSKEHGYRLYHWFGPTWSRVDLRKWDRRATPVIQERVESTGAPRIGLPQVRPIRWKLTTSGATFALHRNGDKIWEFTDEDRPVLDAGAITLDISLQTRDPVAPMYFDDLRVTSTDEGIADKIRRVYDKSVQVPGHFVAAHAQIQHRIRIQELMDTGMDELRTDLPNGRMYRIITDVNFPDMSEGEGRKMATMTPYIHLENPDGTPVLKQKIFHGILGSTLPGHRSAAAQLLHLHTAYEELPPRGVAIRTAPAADATGHQQAVACLAQLPKEFNFTAGWEYWLDEDHIHVAGPVEATYNKAGERLYAGRPIRPEKITFTLYSPPSGGINERISKDNRYRDEILRFQEFNHYFLEGENVVFFVDCAAGPDARLDRQLTWQLFDSYVRPLGDPVTAELDAPDSTLGDRADRKLTWRTPPIQVPVSEPGVYWLKVALDDQTHYSAFSIVPKEHQPGKTAANASGLPRLDGNFYPMQPWNKDIHHYVSGAGNSHNPDWYEAVHAYNMLAFEFRNQPAEVLQRVEGLSMGTLKGAKRPDVPRLPDKRLWRQMAANPESLAAFLASDIYQAVPEDAVLTDPDAEQEAKWHVLIGYHLKEWCDYWGQMWAKHDIAIRQQINEVNPDLITTTYGPPLISSFHYGTLYGGKYYGFDWRERVGKPHLINCWQVETYAREFGRPSMTYSPSLALVQMSLPNVDCKWEMYGSVGGVEDSRMSFGRPPHGLVVPNRDAAANHCTELSLAPWYFKDNTFHAASGTHYAPWVGHFTQTQLFGLIDGLRIFHESRAARPVRTTAFVRSYEAAEQDPSWQENSINNSAAEAPAYAYVEARMAGLPGGYFVDIADVAELTATDTDLLVIPSMRGTTPEQVAVYRNLYEAGVSLLCFDDCTGLEDIFGVRRLEEPVAMHAVKVSDPTDVLATIPAAAKNERVTHRDTLRYELDGASEILAGVDQAGERVAPLATIRRPSGKAGAVFFALGATRVGRREKSLNSTNHEGEVASELMRYSLRAAMHALSQPAVTVTEPGSVLAFERDDGSLYVVVLESSFPDPRPHGKPLDVLLTVRGGTPDRLVLKTDKALLETAPHDDRKTVKFSLRPDEVVPIIVEGIQDR